MQITPIIPTINNENNKKIIFQGFVRLRFPYVDKKSLDGATTGLENMVDMIKKIADGKIDIYTRKLYDRAYMPACDDFDKRHRGVLYLDDVNGKYKDSLGKIISFLQEKGYRFLFEPSDLFLEVSKKSKLRQRLFGSVYPNLAKYANASKPEEMLKL